MLKDQLHRIDDHPVLQPDQMRLPAIMAPGSLQATQTPKTSRDIVHGSVLPSAIGQEFDALDLTGLFESEVEEVKRWIEFHKSDEQKFRYKTYLSKLRTLTI